MNKAELLLYREAIYPAIPDCDIYLKKSAIVSGVQWVSIVPCLSWHVRNPKATLSVQPNTPA